jgi:pilus assembly protein Flp/PilA
MRAYRRTLERGQGLVEYALVLVLVAVVVIVILATTGQKVAEIFCDVVIRLGGEASDNIAACAAPRVAILGIGNGATVSGNITIEADVHDNKGVSDTNITSVEFIMDTTHHTENHFHYCLPGGDASCSLFDTHSLSNGSHTLRVIVTDQDNHTGETTVTFTVAN